MIEKTLLAALCVPLGDPTKDTCKMGLPIILWGDPGMGKSETVEGVATFLNLFLATIFPSTCAPEDFSGVPIGNGPGKVKRVCSMEEVMELCELREGVLFIDECTTVGATVQAALMGVVLNRRMGDLKLPPKVRPILAANPPETAAGGHDLTTTLANRCCHLLYKTPSVDEWIDWNHDPDKGRKELEVDMLDAETRVRDGWAAAWPASRSLICSFIRSTGMSMLYSLPAEGHPDRNRAYQTHRSWFYAERALATCIALGMPDEVSTALIRGCVGDGAAVGFIQWRKDANLPDPADMLANGWTPNKHRLDISYYAYSALAGYVASKPKSAEKTRLGGIAYQLLDQACAAGLADLVYRPAVEILNADLLPSSLPSGEGRKAGLAVLARFKDRSRVLEEMAKAQKV